MQSENESEFKVTSPFKEQWLHATATYYLHAAAASSVLEAEAGKDYPSCYITK